MFVPPPLLHQHPYHLAGPSFLDLRRLRCPALGQISVAILETFASWPDQGPARRHRDRRYRCMEMDGTLCLYVWEIIGR